MQNTDQTEVLKPLFYLFILLNCVEIHNEGILILICVEQDMCW